MSELNFDANNVSPRSSFDPLPGWYAMRITGAEIKQSDTAGAMLKLEHEIDENRHPEHRGRKVWSNLCYQHPTSEDARNIAGAMLSALCHAIGKLQPKTTDLLGELVQVKLKVVPAKGNYDAKNDVSGYRPAGVQDAEQTAKPAAAPAVAKPAQAAAPRTAGWKRP